MMLLKYSICKLPNKRLKPKNRIFYCTKSYFYTITLRFEQKRKMPFTIPCQIYAIGKGGYMVPLASKLICPCMKT